MGKGPKKTFFNSSNVKKNKTFIKFDMKFYRLYGGGTQIQLDYKYMKRHGERDFIT